MSEKRNYTEEEIAKLDKIGSNAVRELKSILDELGDDMNVYSLFVSYFKEGRTTITIDLNDRPNIEYALFDGELRRVEDVIL